MNIRPMNKNDMDHVIALHTATLSTTVSSRIGKDYLRCLYNALLSSDNVVLLVAEEKNNIVGAITTTEDLRKTSSDVKKNLYPNALLPFAKAIIRRKIKFSEIKEQIVFERFLLSTFFNPYATILTLFVDPSYHKKGIGKTLVTEIKKRFKKKNIMTFYVDTKEVNRGAQKFYERVGGKKIATEYGSCVYVFTEK